MGDAEPTLRQMRPPQATALRRLRHRAVSVSKGLCSPLRAQMDKAIWNRRVELDAALWYNTHQQAEHGMEGAG